MCALLRCCRHRRRRRYLCCVVSTEYEWLHGYLCATRVPRSVGTPIRVWIPIYLCRVLLLAFGSRISFYLFLSILFSVAAHSSLFLSLPRSWLSSSLSTTTTTTTSPEHFIYLFIFCCCSKRKAKTKKATTTSTLKN